MERYEVYTTETFKRLFKTLDNSEQRWIIKIKSQLEEKPTGKSLSFNWFREKKYHNKRLYFLIENNQRKILLISFVSKKDQQDIINFVKANSKELLEKLRSF